MQGPVPPRVKNFSSLFPKIDQLSLISVQIAIFSLIHVSLASPYFDHDAFMHQALHVAYLDTLILHTCSTLLSILLCTNFGGVYERKKSTCDRSSEHLLFSSVIRVNINVCSRTESGNFKALLGQTAVTSK